MAETKKKPTLRKAPKGSLKEAGDGAVSAKEAAQDVRALEQHEKAAAKKAVRDANEASKERKRQAKQDEKAAKAEAKAAAKKERAERKAQEKAARVEARERDKAKRLARKKGASEEETSAKAGAEAESGAEAATAEEPAAEGAEAAAGAPAADGSETKEESFAEALERDLEDASAHLDGIGGEGEGGQPESKGASGPDVQFVSGDDAYDLPAPDRMGVKRAAGAVGGALRRIPVGRVLIVAALALVVAAVVAAGVFSWNRWWRFDDVADFQGTWQYGDTPYQVTVDGTTMTLSKDAAYDYELDTFQKAVTFHFGDLKGHGSYAFSEDRSTLVIVDGRTPDIGTILGFTDITENAGVENDGTSTVVVLKRVGGAPAEEPTPQPAQPADDASQSEGEDATDEGATPDEGSDESSESVDVDNLGNDPGEDTGSNVVTPEDLGITLTDEEEE